MFKGYWAAVVIFTVFVSMLGLVKLVSKHFHLPSSRKAIHLGGGLLACTFPWMGAWNYVLPAPVLACVVLFALRFASKRGMKKKAVQQEAVGNEYFLYDTGNMDSYGEVVFPVVMAFLVWITRLEPFLFVTPMAILAISDTAAALIGSKYGKTSIASFGEDKKTRLGSLMFVLFSFAIVALNAALMTGYGWRKSLLLAFMVSIAAAIFEMTGSNGMDNFLVPVAVFILLSVLTPMNYQQILVSYAYMSMLFVVLYLVYITKMISLFSYFQFSMMLGVCILVHMWTAAICVGFAFLILTFEQRHNIKISVAIVKPFVICNSVTIGILGIYQAGILSEKVAALLIICDTIFLLPFTLLFIDRFVSAPEIGERLQNE